jgi:hypothetical protein
MLSLKQVWSHLAPTLIAQYLILSLIYLLTKVDSMKLPHSVPARLTLQTTAKRFDLLFLMPSLTPRQLHLALNKHGVLEGERLC